MALRATFTIETSSTTMNCATTISVSAAQRFGEMEKDIYQLPKSWIYSTIRHHNGRTRYTSVMVELTEIKKALRAPRELASRPSFLLKRLGMISKEKTVDAFEDAGAVPYDYAVLAVLAQGACATQAHIADSLNYDRSYLVGLLDELERRGPVGRPPGLDRPPPARL